MKFKIHYELPNGEPDYVVIEGGTVEEIRKKANHEVNKRNAKNPWSEEIS